jgi:hypothetical protein
MGRERTEIIVARRAGELRRTQANRTTAGSAPGTKGTSEAVERHRKRIGLVVGMTTGSEDRDRWPPARLERVLGTELDMAIRLATLAVNARSTLQAENALALFRSFRAEAKTLTDAGLPTISARLEKIIVDVAKAVETMEGTDKILRAADLADSKARNAAVNGNDAVKKAIDGTSSADQARATEVRKLL